MKKYIIGCFIAIFYISGMKNLLYAQVNTDSLQNHYKQRLIKFLQKTPSVSDYITIAKEGITIYASKQDKIRKKAEYKLDWNDLEVFKHNVRINPVAVRTYYLKGEPLDTLFSRQDSVFKPTSDKPLTGLRVAIDPGHFAGDRTTAKMEGKIVEMMLEDSTKVEFYESVLAWGTAKLLQKKLEEVGAKVILTRQKAGFTALNMTYDDWYRRYAREQSIKGRVVLSKAQAFNQIFKTIDFRARAEIMNKFQPHISLVIHYNVEANNSPWKTPVKDNFSMAFVGGSFEGSDLVEPQKRFHLLRLLVSNDWDNSVQLSQTILKAHQTILNIEPIPKINKQFFLKDYCMFSGEQGIYSRNLSLTREVFGTLCYGESLLQDNEKEVRLLNQKDLNIEGYKLPQRIEEVAEAYFQGILGYWVSF